MGLFLNNDSTEQNNKLNLSCTKDDIFINITKLEVLLKNLGDGSYKLNPKIKSKQKIRQCK